MPTLGSDQIRQILEPFYPEPTEHLLTQLSRYLDLLLKWNARTNLTAIREPEEIVRRHFGESLFAARHLPSGSALLDLGSGAGFPGLPIHLARPELSVTLAESQNKKSSFLREVVRSLDLATEVWASRAETLPEGRRFDVVALRAVDNPNVALAQAFSLLKNDGFVVHLTTSAPVNCRSLPIPGASRTVMVVYPQIDGICSTWNTNISL